jgi:hypothetical protein
VNRVAEFPPLDFGGVEGDLVKVTSDVSPLGQLLGCLRALQWLHITNHWQSAGEPFYGDHLMFERMYSGLTEEIDTLAEKIVGSEGASAVDPAPQISVAASWLARWSSVDGGAVARALRAELDLQAALLAVYSDLEASGRKTMGLDDFLMATASAHESNVYLLRQRSSRTAAAKPDADTAEGHFFDKPRAREVREFAESGSISNEPSVAATAAKPGGLAESPPTPTEIVRDEPASDEFSTLARYVVQTEQTSEAGVPRSHDEVPKHPKIASGLERAWGRRLLG